MAKKCEICGARWSGILVRRVSTDAIDVENLCAKSALMRKVGHAQTVHKNERSSILL